jgi:hypothetical protein
LFNGRNLMIANKDIWRVAQLLVTTHGEDAHAIVAQQAEKRRAEANLVDRNTCRQVLAAVKELQRVKRRKGERIN